MTTFYKEGNNTVTTKNHDADEVVDNKTQLQAYIRKDLPKCNKLEESHKEES